jgi:hypothetical protein
LLAKDAQRISLFRGDLVVAQDEPFLGRKIRQCPRSPLTRARVVALTS